MLGKRSSWFIKYDSSTSTSFWDSPKKARFSTEEEQFQLEPVIERVLSWLNENPRSHPKTEEKLSKLLASLCKISVTVDPQIVYYHLLLNGVIHEHHSGEIEINYHFNINSLKGFILDGSGISPTLSPDFCATMQRVASWCITNTNPPKSKIALLKCLSQLCTYRREIPITVILRWLVKREYISIAPNGVVSYYSLDNLVFPANHYMATEN